MAYQRQRSVEPVGRMARSYAPKFFSPPPQSAPWKLGPRLKSRSLLWPMRGRHLGYGRGRRTWSRKHGRGLLPLASLGDEGVPICIFKAPLTTSSTG
ncbi:unnamed protein product [Prunus armeniaca]